MVFSYFYDVLKDNIVGPANSLLEYLPAAAPSLVDPEDEEDNYLDKSFDELEDSIEIKLESNTIVAGDSIKGYVKIVNASPLPKGSVLRLVVSGKEHVHSFEGKEKEEQINSLIDSSCDAFELKEPLGIGSHKFPFSFCVPSQMPASFAFENRDCAAYIFYTLDTKIINAPDFGNLAFNSRFLVLSKQNTHPVHLENTTNISKTEEINNKIWLAKHCFSDYEPLLIKYQVKSSYKKPITNIQTYILQTFEFTCNEKKICLENILEEKDFPGFDPCSFSKRFLEGLTVPKMTSYSTDGTLVKTKHYLCLKGYDNTGKTKISLQYPITLSPVSFDSYEEFYKCADKDYRPRWVPDEEADSCTGCDKMFFVLFRRHHCRHCGQVFCVICCNNFTTISNLGYHGLTRVCRGCMDIAVTGGQLL